MVADFIQRVSAYPVVSATWQRASGCYTWAKDSSAYARAAAGITEGGLQMAARTAAPLLGRFQGSIASLDQLACRQLDRLEARCPVVKAPTEELVDSTYGYYSNAVKPKVDVVLHPVASAVAGCRRLSDSSVELAAWADRCLDHYLPEEPPARSESAAASARSVGDVGRKLRRRLLSRAAAEAAAAREEFAVRLAAAAAATAADIAAAAADDSAAAARLAAVARRAQAVSRAGVEFAAARLPPLESLPLAGRLVDWLSVYSLEQLQFDPYDLENRRCLALAVATTPELRRNGTRDPRPRASWPGPANAAEDSDDDDGDIDQSE